MGGRASKKKWLKFGEFDALDKYILPKLGKISVRTLTRDGLHKVWMAVREKAGLEDLHIHDFRSMAASESEAQGINPKTAAAILGHADVRTTLKHYTRARNTQEAAARVAAPIAKALSGKIPKGKKEPHG
jgi:integrase